MCPTWQEGEGGAGVATPAADLRTDEVEEDGQRAALHRLVHNPTTAAVA